MQTIQQNQDHLTIQASGTALNSSLNCTIIPSKIHNVNEEEDTETSNPSSKGSSGGGTYSLQHSKMKESFYSLEEHGMGAPISRRNDSSEGSSTTSDKVVDNSPGISITPSQLAQLIEKQKSHLEGPRSPTVSELAGFIIKTETISSENGSCSSTTVSQLDKFITKPRKRIKFKEEKAQKVNYQEVHSKKYLKSRPDEALSFWQFYCYIITFWAPSFILKKLGMDTTERQLAWRAKLGLLSVILYLGIFVSFLTFGFTKTFCDHSTLCLKVDSIGKEYMVIHGKVYRFEPYFDDDKNSTELKNSTIFSHRSNGGMDASFLFQNLNGNCFDLITATENSTVPRDSANGNLAWYYPCTFLKTDGTSNPVLEQVEVSNCHLNYNERQEYYSSKSIADVYFTWKQVNNVSRNLVVYNGIVLDLDLLKWIDQKNFRSHPILEYLLKSDLRGYDITTLLSTTEGKKIARCLIDIIKVGRVDSSTVGCIVSDVVLYVSLTMIVSVVVFKFLVACYFHWTIARKQGAFEINNKEMDKRRKAIEEWSNNINEPGPLKEVEGHLRPKHNSSKNRRFMPQKRNAFYGILKERSLSGKANKNRYQTMTTMSQEAKETILLTSEVEHTNSTDSSMFSVQTHAAHLDNRLIHPDAIVQPSPYHRLYNLPLIHVICFVTCYSEEYQAIRTTLDSLATTDYPNSHKMLMVVCDGIIKGQGNDKTTPEIVLSMVENFVVPPQEVKPHSYVAVTSGSKRHNMAKVYAGFYKYDDSTVSAEKQQKVPILVVVKCGAPSEACSSKPGNRGKRDSQIILMSFLQKVTFDERMTRLEFEMLMSIWQLTGTMANFYEAVLMVDADTKIYPDSLTHMVAELVKDPLIMGICGETKIANKRQSWVTAIQVFEYYISHHQIKAFESVFNSVTCLPGCFSIYRIKSPKDVHGFWVPILANPDIVERYSDNDTRTLRKKNLLLLGEDRYLSSLLLKTFPKRKQIFVPKAACKTVVPDTFKVLLSQRRRWINSTVHNLFELVLVRDLCGTFCFSMQFVVVIELMGTLILPLAICFTIYVILFSIFSSPTPVITLILLALILGLPGFVVVVTISRWSYLLWMLIYLLALPIWNFVLPSYAYWKFDDFSWGDTRTIEGESTKKDDHETEGEFDHSMIEMKTWKTFALETTGGKCESTDYL
ncbi:hypothetical protein KAFR_0C00840 [Kazachstania africana CBS 2517]|uniref:chitin synthase n=1 Tax=Kazachstania africana (strain ATCC 22294 / BCRC 22015 / CBS 2517 / CECT 1963 / NBRC 1671 / NRRL Y-8276) TaxID=1071382 RepID=H2ARS9_KAZAF|nr:hypothetical protein KAFR_0C00840 [Kazachstania africana CBS 2517]CCF57079.1 hypothetical protein KAFR_0C00840 [Kazachstania africana CBS 2517]